MKIYIEFSQWIGSEVQCQSKYRVCTTDPRWSIRSFLFKNHLLSVKSLDSRPTNLRYVYDSVQDMIGEIQPLLCKKLCCVIYAERLTKVTKTSSVWKPRFWSISQNEDVETKYIIFRRKKIMVPGINANTVSSTSNKVMILRIECCIWKLKRLQWVSSEANCLFYQIIFWHFFNLFTWCIFHFPHLVRSNFKKIRLLEKKINAFWLKIFDQYRFQFRYPFCRCNYLNLQYSRKFISEKTIIIVFKPLSVWKGKLEIHFRNRFNTWPQSNLDFLIFAF